MEKEIIKEILEFIKESESIIVILRGEAIDQTQNWKRYPAKRKVVDERINQLWKISEELENILTNLNLEEEAKKKSMVSAEDYNKLLANQKPDDLPVDWKMQLADKKQLELKLIAAQTDLSNEQQVRQQAENKIRQAEQFGLTNWDNLTKQTGNETLASLLGRLQKDELEKEKRDQQLNLITEKLKKLIKKVDDKTSQEGEIDRVETRLCLKTVMDGLEKTVTELEKGVNIEYQNLQLQPPKK